MFDDSNSNDHKKTNENYFCDDLSSDAPNFCKQVEINDQIRDLKLTESSAELLNSPMKKIELIRFLKKSMK